MLYYGYVLALVIFILDRISKWLIVHRMNLYDVHPIIGQFLAITSHRNTGAAFSILENKRWFFIVITIIVVAAVIWYLHKTAKGGKKLMPIALGLLLGGALGNFVDRVATGQVVDFIQLHFQFAFFGHAVDYIYPIFNIADSGIVVGVALIFVDALRGWWRERQAIVKENHGS